MKEKVRFRVYTVNQCGYYKRGEQAPKFGSLDDLFTQIQEWIKGKSVRQTGTYEFRDGDNVLPTFCRSILSNEFGDYLVTTWNETLSGANFFASIAGDDLVDEAQVALAKIPYGNIPGYPTHFWIIPSRKKLITLQFRNDNNGLENLKKYASNFMLFYSPFSVRESVNRPSENSDHMEISISGYSPDPVNTPSQKDVHPRFEAFLFERSEKSIEYVRERLSSVRRVCNKRELHFNVPYEADFTEKVFSLIGIRQVPKLEKPARINLEINFESPTEEQFDAIISEWRKHTVEADNNWDDTGFRLEGADKIFWLNRFYISKVFDLSVQKENEEMIKPESLMKEISARRAEFLKGLTI